LLIIEDYVAPFNGIVLALYLDLWGVLRLFIDAFLASIYRAEQLDIN